MALVVSLTIMCCMIVTYKILPPSHFICPSKAIVPLIGLNKILFHAHKRTPLIKRSQLLVLLIGGEIQRKY